MKRTPLAFFGRDASSSSKTMPLGNTLGQEVIQHHAAKATETLAAKQAQVQRYRQPVYEPLADGRVAFDPAQLSQDMARLDRAKQEIDHFVSQRLQEFKQLSDLAKQWSGKTETTALLPAKRLALAQQLLVDDEVSRRVYTLDATEKGQLMALEQALEADSVMGISGLPLSHQQVDTPLLFQVGVLYQASDKVLPLPRKLLTLALSWRCSRLSSSYRYDRRDHFSTGEIVPLTAWQSARKGHDYLQGHGVYSSYYSQACDQLISVLPHLAAPSVVASEEPLALPSVPVEPPSWAVSSSPSLAKPCIHSDARCYYPLYPAEVAIMQSLLLPVVWQSQLGYHEVTDMTIGCAFEVLMRGSLPNPAISDRPRAEATWQSRYLTMQKLIERSYQAQQEVKEKPGEMATIFALMCGEIRGLLAKEDQSNRLDMPALAVDETMETQYFANYQRALEAMKKTARSIYKRRKGMVGILEDLSHPGPCLAAKPWYQAAQSLITGLHERQDQLRKAYEAAQAQGSSLVVYADPVIQRHGMSQAVLEQLSTLLAMPLTLPAQGAHEDDHAYLATLNTAASELTTLKAALATKPLPAGWQALAAHYHKERALIHYPRELLAASQGSADPAVLAKPFEAVVDDYLNDYQAQLQAAIETHAAALPVTDSLVTSEPLSAVATPVSSSSVAVDESVEALQALSLEAMVSSCLQRWQDDAGHVKHHGSGHNLLWGSLFRASEPNSDSESDTQAIPVDEENAVAGQTVPSQRRGVRFSG